MFSDAMSAIEGVYVTNQGFFFGELDVKYLSAHLSRGEDQQGLESDPTVQLFFYFFF